MQTAQFLPAWLYCEPYIAELEYELYAKRCWHPIAAGSELGAEQALALELLGLPLLLTRPESGPIRVFLNRCPHRGVALLDTDRSARDSGPIRSHPEGACAMALQPSSVSRPLMS
jgi:carnitine monooxygenase subunit